MKMDIEQFLRMEEKLNLYDLKIKEFHFWNFVRFYVWTNMICRNKNSQNVKSNKINGKEIFGIAYNLFFPGKIRIDNADLLIYNHMRRVFNGKYFECMYTEQISDHFSRSIVIEQNYRGRHMKPVKTKNLFYLDRLSLKGVIGTKLSLILKKQEYEKMYRTIAPVLEEIFSEILKDYHVQIDKKELFKEIFKNYILYKIKKPAYKKILIKYNPKIVIEVVGYGKDRMILNEAANELGIEVVELQHGVMYNEHVAYQYATQKKLQHLPTQLWTFSEFANQFIRMPRESTKIVGIGFPYFEKQVEYYKRNVNRTDSRKTVIFISQGTIGVEMSKFAVELNQRLCGYRIIYKLHPGEFDVWQKEYPWLKNSTIEIYDDFETNIYELFAVSDIQVGAYSTAIYEGLGFGLQTFILDTGYLDSTEELVKNKCATKVRTVDEMIWKIDGKDNHYNNIGYYWKPDAIENMFEQINNILGKTEKNGNEC